jgi:hypothetical protein
MEILTAPFREAAHRHLRRFHQQEPQDRAALLGSELRACFTADQLSASCRTASSSQEASWDDLVRLTVDVRLKRCGGEMPLVISPETSKAQVATPLLKAIVRAHKWREGVLAGAAPNRIVAAKRLDLNEEYLRRVLGCAFLAPDIVEAILDGRHPSGLTVKKLSRRHLPLDWAEQRMQLGFSPLDLRAKPRLSE